MGADIDQLNIKIEADAQKAHSSVDTLINKLGRLNAALGGINTSNLTSLSNGIQRLSSSMQSMKNVGTADFTRLAKNIQKMGQLDSKQLGKAAGSIHRFVNALGTIDKINVSDNAAQIGQLAKGISQLGYKSSTQAIENIPKLSKAMRQLMTELSKAPRVSQNLIQMTEALAKLSRTGASSGRAASSLGSALDRYTASTHRAKKGSFSLASAIGKVYATYWTLFRAMGLFRKAIDISSQLTEVQNVVDVTFGDMSSKVDEFAKHSIEQFGMSELSVKQYASRFQAMGSAMGISGSSIGSANNFLNKQTNGYVGLSDSMSDVSLNLTKLTADMASFYDVEQSVVAEDLESIFTGQTRPLRQYGLDLTQATLQEWALKNGIDANVQSMSQAEKTMLRYQYVLANTGAAQGDFARTANTWANQVRILKQNFQQLGSIVGGTLINAFKPLVQALNSVMGKLIAFAETVSNALGKIFGWKFEKGSGGAGTTGLATDMADAADSAGGLADKTGKAAKNIKDMKAGLRAFDELKTISIPDKGSGSGGSGSGGSGGSGGAGGASGGSGGQWVKQDSIFEDYKSSIDSLYGLGEYIGNALKGAMDSIKWDEIYEKARGFGAGLASFLNGLFSGKKGETLLGKVGKTIAGTLNTVISASLGFTDTFDFTQFGLNLSDSVNQFFKTFNFAGLAQAINGWVDGLWDTVISFFKNLDYKAIFSGLKYFITNLDSKTIATIIGIGTIRKFGKQIASAIAENVGVKLSLKNVGITILGVTFAWSAGTEIGKLIDKWIADEIRKSGGDLELADLYENFHWTGEDGFFDQIFGNGESVTETIYDIGTALQMMYADIFDAQAQFWGLNISANDFLKTIRKLPKKVIGIGVKITTTAKELWSGFKKGWDKFKKDPLGFALSIISKAKDLWDGFKAKWGETRTANFLLKIASKISELWNDFKTGWGDSRVVKFLLKRSTTVKKLWDSFSIEWGTSRSVSFILKRATTVKKLWDNFKDGWGDKKSVQFLLKRATTVKKLWDEFKGSWGVSKKVQIGISFFKGALSNLWTSVKNAFSGKSVEIGTKAATKADGGAFYNGSWHDIPQYAAGGFPTHGTVFVAGENGPEITGHIGGRTEVLNQSQLASTMYASVLSAMETALSNRRYSSQQPIQVYLDGKVVFDNTRERATEYFNRTGEPAFPI